MREHPEQKKILLISSGQPSLNPRLVKEADTLASNGYDVTVIYAYWNDWATELDKDLLAAKKWKAVRAGGDPTDDKLTYFFSRLIFKCAKTLSNLSGNSLFAEIAVARSASYLIREAKKHLADLYIGHNLGALPAVVKAAKKHNKPCGFDAEDFHRYETSDDPSSQSFKIAKHLEDKYLKALNYLTTASPLISAQYQALYPQLQPVTVLNVFPAVKIPLPDNINNGPIRLFWFSQTIGPGRGLEVVADALRILNEETFQLHLLGDARQCQSFVSDLTITAKNIFIHPVIPAEALISFASQFDIGLAAENNPPFNRDICLTNKLFTYLQAGLAIAATDTTSQTQFVEQNPEVGALYDKNDAQSLAAMLSAWAQNRQLLLQKRRAALVAAQSRFNWEAESQETLKLIKNTLAG